MPETAQLNLRLLPSRRLGLLQDVDLMAMFDFEDNELIPAMEAYNYHVAVKPFDLILGLAGTHSSFTKMFKEVAESKKMYLCTN